MYPGQFMEQTGGVHKKYKRILQLTEKVSDIRVEMGIVFEVDRAVSINSSPLASP